MATEFKLPEVGENIEKATVIRVLVNEGDTVKKEQTLVEIETDKATIEVPSTVTSKVGKIKVKEGESVPVGATLMTIAEEGEAGESRPARAEKAPKEEPPVSRKQEARRAEEQRETAAAEEAPEPEEDSRERKAAPRREARVEQLTPAARKAPPAPGQTVPASPSVRRLAREIGVDISEVEGTGPGGRISEDDVKAHARRQAGGAPRPARAAARPAVSVSADLPDFSRWGEIEAEPLNNIRRVISERLSLSWQTIPHVHHHDKADITELEELRRRRNAAIDDPARKLTVTAVLLKVLGKLLRRHPKFNASLDAANNQLILKHYCHIGVAADTERGLLVPVVRDVDRKSISELVADLHALAGRAREGKLSPEEMSGGTFTVSNLGGIGGVGFTPIINLHEVAILGVSRAAYEQVFDREGNGRVRLLLPVCLGYDHRVIDGAEAARFVREMCELLTSPFDMLFEI